MEVHGTCRVVNDFSATASWELPMFCTSSAQRRLQGPQAPADRGNVATGEGKGKRTERKGSFGTTDLILRYTGEPALSNLK